MVEFEDVDGSLNETTMEMLGETISYRPAGGAAVTPAFKAIVDYGDNAEQLSGSRVITGDCAVEISKSDRAAIADDDVIELPKRPGQLFLPKNVMTDESGDAWLVVLKLKPV